MPIIDLTALTDPELEGLAGDVNAERRRRADIDGIPTRACALVDEYAAVGGDIAALVAAVQARADEVRAPRTGKR